MKRRFQIWLLSGMLLGIFCTGALAQSDPHPADSKQKKEKVQIIVVKKKERDKSKDGEAKKPRSESKTPSANLMKRGGGKIK